MPVQREWEVRLRARVHQSVGVVRTYDAPDPVMGFIQQVLKEAGRDQEVATDIKIVKVGVCEMYVHDKQKVWENACRIIISMMASDPSLLGKPSGRLSEDPPPMVRDPCNLYTKEPFPQSHAGEQYTVSSRRSLSLSLKTPLQQSINQNARPAMPMAKQT